MVALLWEQGNQPAVVPLVARWNRLDTTVRPFSLLCAYPLPLLVGAAYADAFRVVKTQCFEESLQVGQVLYRAGTCYLSCTVDAPEPSQGEADEYVGVDVGVTTLAATSDGELLNQSTGPKPAHINQVLARYSRFRAKLQKKGTTSAKQLLKKRSGKERRFGQDVTHCISQALVRTAHGARHPARDRA